MKNVANVIRVQPGPLSQMVEKMYFKCIVNKELFPESVRHGISYEFYMSLTLPAVAAQSIYPSCAPLEVFLEVVAEKHDTWVIEGQPPCVTVWSLGDILCHCIVFYDPEAKMRVLKIEKAPEYYKEKMRFIVQEKD